MAAGRLIVAFGIAAAVLAGGFVFWRYYWFFRNPSRTPPVESGLVSPAEGTVVYVRKVGPHEEVVSIKKGVRATIRDLLREEVDGTKLIIGIFMSPFDVHYNRVPLTGTIDFIRRHGARGENLHMGPMHWRTLMNLEPRYAGSLHIIQNERTVTRFVANYRGAPLSYYVVQIGARTVNGIDSYFGPGEVVERGRTFGMIRIGSQVDLVVPWRPELETLVHPGDTVRAGETLIIR